MFQSLIQLAYLLHISGGTMGLVTGLVALSVKKGGRVHRFAGTVFVWSMVTMATAAGYLALVLPDYVNLVIATFALYLILTAWLTVRRKEGAIGVPEKLALLLIAALCVPFGVLSAQLALGMAPFIKSTVPLKGPVLIAIYGFTLVTAIAALSDLRVCLAGGISGVARVARHLWRMCLGLTLAAGSAFTNGLPRLLPGHVEVTFIFFVPQLLVLCALVFWMIRVHVNRTDLATEPEV